MYLMLKQVCRLGRRIEGGVILRCLFLDLDVDALHQEFVRRGAKITDE